MAAAGATIVAASNFPDSEIVLAGEHTFGQDKPSTGLLMSEELIIAGVEPERIVVLDDRETGLNNTSFQVNALRDWLTQLDRQPNLLTLAYRFHIKRTRRYLLNKGVDSEFGQIEAVLSTAGLFDSYPQLMHLSSFDRREALMRAVSVIDRGGAFIRLITSLRGPHVHDLNFNSDGEPVFMDMSARSRLAELNPNLTAAD